MMTGAILGSRAEWVLRTVRAVGVVLLVLLVEADGLAEDCNRNGRSDAEDIAAGESRDCNSNGVPDECDVLTVVAYDAPSGRVLGADLNADGSVDLVAGNLLLGNLGDGTFAPKGELPSDPLVTVLAAGDLDGDGDQDIVAEDRPFVFRNRGGWSFRRGGPLLDDSAYTVQLGDLDGDGDLDVVGISGRPEAVLALLENQGDGSFKTSWKVPAGADRAAALGDLDGDGDLDLVTHFRIFFNDGPGRFSDPVPTGWQSEGESPGVLALALGDLDGDGDLDIAAGENKVVTVLWNRDDALARGPRAASHSILHSLVPADLDGDGDLDLVSNWYPLLNAGNGTFHLGPFGISYSLWFHGPTIVVADLDGDGDLDLAGGEDPQGIKVALNHEDPSFGISRDYNGNGVPDECELSCGHDSDAVVTDGFRFMATSDQGAVGDVVAVDVFLEVEDPRPDLKRIRAIGCYDASVAEILPQPRYSELWDRVSLFPEFIPFRPGTWYVKDAPSSTLGFMFGGRLLKDSVIDLLPTSEPLHLATLFFRLNGAPGDSFEVSFCDDVFARPLYIPSGSLDCLRSELVYERSVPPVTQSGRHTAGLVRILAGDPTRPEPPDLPPLARVYPEPPDRQSVAATFELTGDFVSPGDHNVPVDLFITSAFEFSGYTVGVTFPPRYLSISRVEEQIRPGVKRIDNESGYLVLAMLDGLRRVGAEGERVRIATLFLDVKDQASEVNRIELRLEPAGNPPISNWVEIQHLGAGSGSVPVATRVEPLELRAGVLNVLPEVVVFIRGDSNWDSTVDISDAKATLGFLFLGTDTPVCPDAADANDDGILNIADPMATLQFLFLHGRTLPRPREPGMDPTPDGLGCFGHRD